MDVPEGFRYADVLAKGRPVHGTLDEFRIRHPGMDAGKRAKIFAPFDALRGFSGKLAAKDVPYVDRRDVLDSERDALDAKLRALAELTVNGRAARKNAVEVTVTWFEPCADAESEWFGLKGLYRTVTGVCLRADAAEGKLDVDGTRIAFGDILSLESEAFGETQYG